MRFKLPNAVPAIDNADIAIDGEEHSKDLIGDEAINKGVGETIPAYEEILGIDLATSARERHSRLGGLAFGKIGKDVAKLTGLAAAIENISLVVKDGKALLAQAWKGESYDAFRANIEKLEKTLDDYAAAVRTTAAGLETAMSNIRTMYLRYRDDCLGTHFTWKGVSKPGDWWKMSGDSGRYLSEHCVSTHIGGCYYALPGTSALLQDRLTTNHLFNDILEKWDCTDDMDVVVNQYRFIVGEADKERGAIHDRINAYCDEAEQVRAFVGEAYDAALDNLRILAEANVFSHLSVPGATGGGDPGPGGDPGSGGYPGGGGGFPGGGSPDAAMPPPRPNPAPEPEPVEPAAVQPEPTDPAATDPPADESVQIRDGDRTISVTSSDGEGQVRVTVDDGSGKPKTYDLDFDAASGLEPGPAEGRPAPDPNAEHVPAGTNGKCVIDSGGLTVTTERSLFDQNTITVTVDNGSDKPTTYTLDLTDDAPSGSPSPAPSPSADARPADVPMARPPGAPAASEPPPADEPAAEGSPTEEVADPPADDAPTGAGVPAPDAGAESPAVGQADEPTADASAAEGLDESAEAESATVPADPAPVAGEPAAGASELPETASTSTEAATPPPVEEAGAAESAAVEPADAVPAAVEPATADPAAAPESPQAASAQATSTQGWTDDQRGSVSGVLVPDQPTGEAGLATADDGDPAGSAGSAMPMMAGAGSSGNADSGRAGTGWSVHGDLYDNGDPVYSMHGVLGEDDLDDK